MEPEHSLVQLLTTLRTEVQAVSMARELVEARAAACVQVVGPITSVYRWEGETREEHEYLCLMKVPGERLEALVSAVRERHPYDTPEVAALPCTFVDERYLAWARREVSSPPSVE
jgi:periplasmic divalent cation tolerance protein